MQSVSYILEKIIRDPRYYQIFFLTLFLVYGNVALGWVSYYPKYAGIALGAIGTQLIGNFLFGQSNKNIPSAIITTLGLSLLLKTEDIYIAVLAGIIAISAKFIFKSNGRHFVNPANFGLVVAVLFSGKAWISPGQWGFDGLLFFIIGTLGSVVCSKAKRIDVALFFIGTLLLLQILRSVVYLDWPFDFIIQSFSSGSILLFTFFMITDPVSTPQSKLHRRIFAVTVACLAFYLSNFKFLNSTPIYALFLINFTTPIIELLIKKIKEIKILKQHTPIMIANQQ